MLNTSDVFFEKWYSITEMLYGSAGYMGIVQRLSMWTRYKTSFISKLAYLK